MIRLHDIARNYGVHEVLRGVDWSISPGSRVGLVGPNGSGKTTLLRLIAGLEVPDGGTVDVARGATLGYLPQEGARLPGGTLLEALLEPFREVHDLERELERLHHEMATATGARLEALTRQSGEVQHRFEAAGGFDLEIRARVILGGLGFGPEDPGRPLREFSGGYRMRAALGALLLRRPDYLLLDEPTNHLDLEAVGWLEGYLADTPSALVVVSHDRTFLNRLVGSIAEIEGGRVRVWAGNYDRFRREKGHAREIARKKAAQEAHRVGEIERFIERFRYKATKARQVQSRIKMLEKMERTEELADDFSWRFDFPPVARSAQRVALLTSVKKAYAAQPVLKGVDLEIFRGDRVALVGPNGCGKSTLLQVIAGRILSDDGQIEIGEKVVLHYFAQHVLETLNAGATVLEELQAWAPGRTVQQLRSLLGIFQFSGEDAFKKVEVLSGGEKNRLALARLCLDPGNFLLLDEPTNHLDLPTREALEEALSRFGGTLLFVSHDRYFINKVATRVAAFHDGRLALYQGGFDDYLARMAADAAGTVTSRVVPGSGGAGGGKSGGRGEKPLARTKPIAAPASPASRGAGPPSGREQRRLEAEVRNRRNRELRFYRDRIAALEAKILPHETRLKEIDAALARPDTYRETGQARAQGEEKKALEIELAHLYDEWDHATTELQREEGKRA